MRRMKNTTVQKTKKRNRAGYKEGDRAQRRDVPAKRKKIAQNGGKVEKKPTRGAGRKKKEAAFSQKWGPYLRGQVAWSSETRGNRNRGPVRRFFNRTQPQGFKKGKFPLSTGV